MLEEEKKVEATPVANETPAAAPVETPKENNNAPRHPRGDRRPNGKRPHGDKKMEKDDGFKDRVVFINRVSKTVKGGRRMKFTALVVIGDGKGTYGFACSKAAEVPDAIKKANDAARKNLFKVHLVKGDTIPHEIMGKFGACSVLLKPAPEGTGIIAGGPVRAVLELAGVRNVCSKVYGSRAAINVIRATNQGLQNLKSYKKTKELRGKEE